jgi:hypothetical protein
MTTSFQLCAEFRILGLDCAIASTPAATRAQPMATSSPACADGIFSIDVLSTGGCNGVLHACSGGNDVEGGNVGGIFWRENGPIPQSHFVREWPVNDKRP